jgi:DNA-binding response OmpR family regulator
MADPSDRGEDLHGIHVLVVDDNADARMIFKSILVYAGAAVLVASSAVAAASTLKHIRPSVVLTDLSMPRRDGMWLVQWIRHREAKRGTHLPVIAVSARDDVYEEANVLTSGFDDYLVKPVEPADLFAAIARIARRSVERARSEVSQLDSSGLIRSDSAERFSPS